MNRRERGKENRVIKFREDESRVAVRGAPTRGLNTLVESVLKFVNELDYEIFRSNRNLAQA